MTERCKTTVYGTTGAMASSPQVETIFGTRIIQDVDNLLVTEMISMLFGRRVISLQSSLPQCPVSAIWLMVLIHMGFLIPLSKLSMTPTRDIFTDTCQLTFRFARHGIMIPSSVNYCSFVPLPEIGGNHMSPVCSRLTQLATVLDGQYVLVLASL